MIQTITRQTVDLVLEPHHREAFMRWAFGLHYLEYTQDIFYMRVWNKRHGVILTLQEQDTIVEDVQYMIEIWEEVQCARSRKSYE